MHRFITVTGLVLLVALPAASQQPSVLTFDDALARARESAPAIVASRMRIDEARARIIGASLFFPSNPMLEVETGRRSGATATTDYGLEVAQDFDLPARRRARMDATHAVIAQEEQRVREIEGEVLRDVAMAFLRAVEARERGDAAAGGKRLAEEALRIAERRYAAGDVAQLDVNLARTAVARADGETRITAAALTAQTTQLQVLLGFTEPCSVSPSR